MAEFLASPQQKESFWSRVRQALEPRAPMPVGASRPMARQRSAAKAPPAGTGFGETLAHHWAHCASRRVSIAMLTISVDGEARAIAETVAANLPRGDDCGFLVGGRHVVLLPDYPLLMAKVAARRLIGALGEGARIGVAIANPADGAGDSLFGASLEALDKARSGHEGPIASVDLRSLSRGAA